MMKQIIRLTGRMIKALVGLFICVLGVVLTINAGIGRAPWDVFYQGLARQTGITFGLAWIYSNIVILFILIWLKEPIGIGTAFDMFICGKIADFLLPLDFLPKGTGFVSGLIIMGIGFFIFASGSCLYMSARLGVGPRDNLMIALVKHAHIPIGTSKIILDGSACLAGWLMGGFVGIGTVVAAFGLGSAIQIVFFLAKFDVKTVKQESFADTFFAIRQKALESIKSL